MSTPTPITDWLENLGLGQYAQRFVENEITLSILPDLTDGDLKELGVSPWSSTFVAARNSRVGQRRETYSYSYHCSVGTCYPAAAQLCRAPPSHSVVLGPRRLDGALGAHGP